MTRVRQAGCVTAHLCQRYDPVRLFYRESIFPRNERRNGIFLMRLRISSGRHSKFDVSFYFLRFYIFSIQKLPVKGFKVRSKCCQRMYFIFEKIRYSMKHRFASSLGLSSKTLNVSGICRRLKIGSNFRIPCNSFTCH